MSRVRHFFTRPSAAVFDPIFVTPLRDQTETVERPMSSSSAAALDSVMPSDVSFALGPNIEHVLILRSKPAKIDRYDHKSHSLPVQTLVLTVKPKIISHRTKSIKSSTRTTNEYNDIMEPSSSTSHSQASSLLNVIDVQRLHCHLSRSSPEAQYSVQ